MKKLALLVLALATYCGASAQLKREPYKLTVAVDKSSVYEENLTESPYILPGNRIQLYAGETLFVEVERAGDSIVSLTAVKENQNPSKTLVISFTQIATKKVHESMMLKITNPFKERLFYSASIFLMKQKKWAKTDVLPVEPGLSSFENWPNIILSIGLSEFNFKAK